MTTGLVETIDTIGPSWIPSLGDADTFAPFPVPVPPAAADILGTRRRELDRLRLRPATVSAVREPAPLPHDAPHDAPAADFARRIETQLSFLQKSARRWYRDRPHADDLVQDTVVQALANAHLWRAEQPDCNLRGWLFTIMRNRFLAGVARSKRSDTALDAIAAADECVPAAASRPEARLMLRDLERALALLPAPQRIAIRLVAIEGHTYDEAARLMEMTVAALRCHLSRGRERLREMVAGRITPPRRARPGQPAKPVARRSQPALNTTMHREFA